MKRRLLFSLGSIAICVLGGQQPGIAQLATAAGASAVFFPIVVADGTHDTVVQLANGSPQRVFVHCLYTPGGPGGVQQAMPFDLVLLARQPTHWRASTGRSTDPNDPACERGSTDCDGAGIDPGLIPPLPDGFEGDLLCVQVDRSRAPMSGNALRGAATLLDTVTPDVAKYAAVGLSGSSANDADETLCLGGEVSDTCPHGAEYTACPESWFLEHRAEGAAPGSDAGAPGSRTRLIIATCSRRAGTGGAPVQVRVTSELEQSFSTSLSVQRWADIPLGGMTIFDRNLLGGDFVQTRLSTAQVSPGIVVVALTDRASTAGEAAGGAVIAVPFAAGVHAGQDRILLADE
jgi:hypothetical protein